MIRHLSGRRLCLSLLSCGLLYLATAATADAATGPCFPGHEGTKCRFWTAKVVAVNDGDTAIVDLDGDRGHRHEWVRFRGVQAMELRVHSPRRSRRRGECHAVAATNRVENLVRASHRRVRLSAQRPSRDAFGRLERWVAVRRNGRWQDVGEMLMREGHTLWLTSNTDIAWNRRYDLAGQEAAAAQRRIWAATTCGAGPQQEIPIKIWANWNPPGYDSADGEYVKVQNRSAGETLHLGGWWVREAGQRRFTFPPGTDVAPGTTATLHVGPGRRSGNEFFWGLAVPVFENPGDGRDLGDGAYLFDPNGDLRAWMLYPCAVGCSDPLQGAVEVSAEPRRPERALITNRSNTPVDLSSYAVAISSVTVPLAEGTVIGPGETVTMYMQGDPGGNSRLEQYAGIEGDVLPDRGGWLSVSTFSGVSLDCDAWGGSSCATP